MLPTDVTYVGVLIQSHPPFHIWNNELIITLDFFVSIMGLYLEHYVNNGKYLLETRPYGRNCGGIQYVRVPTKDDDNNPL